MMYIMLTFQLSGGLGNQLFQIFATLAFALKAGQLFRFPYFEYIHEGDNTVRCSYWNTFLIQLKKYTETDLLISDPIYLTEQNHRFNELSIGSVGDYVLNGYFQSYKYFNNEFEQLCEMIELEEQKENVLLAYPMFPLKSLNATISMHFRLGDYKTKSAYHPIMSVDYYVKSLNYIINKLGDENSIVVFYFCEDEDIHHVDQMIHEIINKVGHGISFNRISSSIPDWQQLLLMSQCKHNIIANSTFSLWASYFNTDKNKIVCYPKLWFGHLITHVTDDMFPEDYICID